MKGLTVIIPVKPPEPYLPTLLKQIYVVLSKIKHEIFVQTEQGLTNAVIEGVKKSSYNTIVVMDSDGSHNPTVLVYMYRLMNEHELVIGSKAEGVDETSFTRRLISRVYCWLARTLLKLNVQDPMSGYVMASKNLFQQLKPSTDYKFLLQLLTHNPRPKIIEVPIIFRKRQKGKSKAAFRTGLKTFNSIIKLWWNKK